MRLEGRWACGASGPYTSPLSLRDTADRAALSTAEFADVGDERRDRAHVLEPAAAAAVNELLDAGGPEHGVGVRCDLFHKQRPALDGTSIPCTAGREPARTCGRRTVMPARAKCMPAHRTLDAQHVPAPLGLRPMRPRSLASCTPRRL